MHGRNRCSNCLDPQEDSHGVTLVFLESKIYLSIRHGRIVAHPENISGLEVYGVTRFDDDSVNAMASVTVGALFVYDNETLEIREIDGFKIIASEHNAENAHLRTVAVDEHGYDAIEERVRQYYS